MLELGQGATYPTDKKFPGHDNVLLAKESYLSLGSLSRCGWIGRA